MATIGEGLDKEELTAFMELACEPWSERDPDLIDINRIARILLPDLSNEVTLKKEVIQSKTLKTMGTTRPEQGATRTDTE